MPFTLPAILDRASLKYCEELNVRSFFAHCRQLILQGQKFHSYDELLSKVMSGLFGVELNQIFGRDRCPNLYRIEQISVNDAHFVSEDDGYLSFVLHLRPVTGGDLLEASFCYGLVEMERLRKFALAARDHTKAVQEERAARSHLRITFGLEVDQVFRFPRSDEYSTAFIFQNARPAVLAGEERGKLALELDVLLFEKPEAGLQRVYACPIEPGYFKLI